MTVRQFLEMNTNTNGDISYSIMYNIQHYTNIHNENSFGYNDNVDYDRIEDIDEKYLNAEVLSFYIEGNELCIGTNYRD